jgi:hypothetical protein
VEKLIDIVFGGRKKVSKIIQDHDKQKTGTKVANFLSTYIILPFSFGGMDFFLEEKQGIIISETKRGLSDTSFKTLINNNIYS